MSATANDGPSCDNSFEINPSWSKSMNYFLYLLKGILFSLKKALAYPFWYINNLASAIFKLSVELLVIF
jgi:hypothetical protein